MEQHPVPQNVTTFQFRLIGDMTIKQFGYLAGGAILAYICYKLPLPFIITWPLAAIFGLLGVGFAFVPVEERPMDVWVFSFFKSIYAPTQYIWSRGAATRGDQQKTEPASPPPVGGVPLPKPETKNVVAQLFAQRADAIAASGVVTQHEPRQVFAWLTDMFNPRPRPTAPVAPVSVPMVTGTRLTMNTAVPAPQPAPTVPAIPAAPEHTAGELEEKIQQLTGELSTKEASETRILELQKQLTDLMAEKMKMEKEMMTMRQRMSRPTSPLGGPAFPPLRQGFAGQATSPFMRSPLSPSPSSVQQSTNTGPTVKVITQESAVRSGLPRLTSVPNVVTGITKDNQGNLLPGVLITVRDREDVPLRALKTNKLGQFAASTPLPDGTYLVEVEDPRSRFVFDRAQVTLTGAVAPPLEITAKSQKELTRNKLAAEIFGKPDM